jgi:hypothetical protein
MPVPYACDSCFLVLLRDYGLAGPHLQRRRAMQRHGATMCEGYHKVRGRTEPRRANQDLYRLRVLLTQFGYLFRQNLRRESREVVRAAIKTGLDAFDRKL